MRLAIFPLSSPSEIDLIHRQVVAMPAMKLFQDGGYSLLHPNHPHPAFRWTSCLESACLSSPGTTPVIGVLPGEGIGPEVVASAIQVLEKVANATGLRVELR